MRKTEESLSAHFLPFQLSITIYCSYQFQFFSDLERYFRFFRVVLIIIVIIILIMTTFIIILGVSAQYAKGQKLVNNLTVSNSSIQAWEEEGLH